LVEITQDSPLAWPRPAAAPARGGAAGDAGQASAGGESFYQPNDVEKEVMATAIADHPRAAPWIMEERWNFPP
jgi:hypothetical protein